MAWTIFSDVTDRWVGGNEPTDEPLVNSLIDDAEAVILSEYPGIQARIDSGALSLNVVVMVVCRMVTRMLRNPENLTYFQQTTGPFGNAKNFGAGTSDIWLSDDERNMIGPKKGGKAFSIDLASDAGVHAVSRYTESELINMEVSGLPVGDGDD